MKVLTINNKKLDPIPENWNEFTKEQLLFMANLIVKFDITYFKILQILEIIGLKIVKQQEAIIIENEECFLFAYRKLPFLISAADIKFISDHLLFIFKKVNDDKETKYFIDSKLSKNLLPNFSFNTKKYYGPADAITNLYYSEYIHAYTNYIRYQKTQEIKYIDNLIAILYRRKKIFHFIRKKLLFYNGDIRKKFNDHFIEKNAKRFSKLHHKYKLSILWYFEGSIAFLTKKFPNVFDSTGAKSKTEIFESFLRLTDTLSKNDPTKTKDIRNTYLYEIMINMDQAAIKYNKELEYYESLKNKK